MTDSNSLALAERAAMALGEIGYKATVDLAPRRFPPHEIIGHVFSRRGSIPVDVMWRAWITAGSPLTPCLACYKWARPRGVLVRRSECSERGLGTRDCGADRSEWES